MKLIADLHIHSKYSAATSTRMDIPDLVYFAEMKGLSILGTGDALHPVWRSELKKQLNYVDDGLYTDGKHENIYFITQTEVATIHTLNKKARRIHHVILMPSLEVAEQLSDILKKYGDVESDGRPILNITPAELVEHAIEVDEMCIVFPAHAWTPWWSMLGAFSGVDRIEECYEDMVKYVYAIETGLSSDPPMNWRVSWIDNYTLLSFSDSHSPYPYRLGREAVVFNLKKPSYREIHEAVKNRDPEKIVMTVEVPPEYGKYHWSGHRNCNFGPIPPEEARRLNYKCPVCGRKLTKGVEDRVEELADRPRNYKPAGSIGYIHLIPLQELIALSMGIDVENESKLNSTKVWREYEKLLNIYGSEFKILLEVPEDELIRTCGENISRIISLMRRDAIKIIPGYDGVYGKLILEEKEEKEHSRKIKSLEDYL
ncbi:MAG: endonuclease Q family protein [Nitrososphaerota archaeon]|nr:endonuclease Q family protein [Candidatus Geocrenenecus dongiae]